MAPTHNWFTLLDVGDFGWRLVHGYLDGAQGENYSIFKPYDCIGMDTSGYLPAQVWGSQKMAPNVLFLGKAPWPK
ncbi:hypothetical protein AB0O82_24465 [Kitasatospora sp. NPDC088264]|uniref:hypothetical protein n=2 Tax=Kitasatospora TaxID=2063 RepID=UPI003411FA64